MGKDLFSFSNIHSCYRKCRARKRNTANALRFELKLDDNPAAIVTGEAFYEKNIY